MKPIISFIKTIYKISYRAMFVSFCSTVLKSIVPIVTLLLSSRLIRVLTIRADVREIVFTILGIIFWNLSTGFIQIFLNNRFHTLMVRLKDDFSLHIGERMMQMQYGKLESAYVQDLKQQALLPVIEWGTFEFILQEFFPAVLGSIITIVTTFFLVSEYKVWLLLPVLLTVVLHLILSNIKNKRFQSVMMKVALIERKLGYYQSVTNDFSLGKDIRIFRIDKILMNKIRTLNDKEIVEFSKLFYHAAFLDFWETVILQFQIYLVYVVAAIDLLRKVIRIDYFFQITGLFINFGNSMFQLMNAFVNLKARSRFLEKLQEFEQIPVNKTTDGTCYDAPCEVEFAHVSFGYDASKEILSDVSFVIPKGKKVAIVGENGSGKTTIAKLLSGFLSPTRGQICINGQPLETDGRQFMSAVYQDFQMFAFTIKENIETSYQGSGNVIENLQNVGMLEKVQSLKSGADTYLYKIFEKDGTEFSYGQSQKLATARALYKNAGIIILDEPTSAFDAQAEYEIFQDFQHLTEGKTALLISHRLWSCQFCDQILVVANHGIVERGTHEALMKKENGTYRQMFLAQAQYYEGK